MDQRQQLIENIQHSLYKGFIDKNQNGSSQFSPKLLTNKYPETVLTTLLQELKICETFMFSVAFVTEGGLATLKAVLYDLKQKGIRGRIITSTFLNFNQPKMFKELLKLENVEVRLASAKGFHSKGYIFEHHNHYSLIIGSSNLTDNALKANYEWNLYFTSLEHGEVIYQLKSQFEEAWNEATPLTKDWINHYKQLYDLKPIIKQNDLNVLELDKYYLTSSIVKSLTIRPNKMQESALKNLAALRSKGGEKH